MSTDDQQWIDARRPWVDITSGESVAADLAIPRILTETPIQMRRELIDEWGGVSQTAYSPFRIDDNDTLVYTDHQGLEYMIEIKAFLISDDPEQNQRQRRADRRQRQLRRANETDFRAGLLTQE